MFTAMNEISVGTGRTLLFHNIIRDHNFRRVAGVDCSPNVRSSAYNILFVCWTNGVTIVCNEHGNLEGRIFVNAYRVAISSMYSRHAMRDKQLQVVAFQECSLGDTCFRQSSTAWSSSNFKLQRSNVTVAVDGTAEMRRDVTDVLCTK